jgi:hypothetical protein
MEMPEDDARADALLAQKIAPLHGLRDRSNRSNRSNKSYRRSARVGVPRGGIINRVGGVKMVAKGKVGRAAATLGVTRTTRHRAASRRNNVTLCVSPCVGAPVFVIGTI